MIPNDPVILLSYINTLLRDRYSSLSALCEDQQLDAQDILDKLSHIDYSYDEEKNQFIWKFWFI